MTVFGIEVLGLTWCGEAETYVEPAPRRPLIAGVVDQHHDEHHDEHDDHEHHESDQHSGHKQGPGQGVVVRVRP